MLFNSLEYFLFLPIVFALYWATNAWRRDAKGLKLQNALLLLSSYIFYGWWDWRFLSLIGFSTLVDWAVGLRIHEANQNDNPGSPDHRSHHAKRWLAVSLFVKPECMKGLKWIEGNDWSGAKNPRNFYDDHHLVGEGAQRYSRWLTKQVKQQAKSLH